MTPIEEPPEVESALDELRVIFENVGLTLPDDLDLTGEVSRCDTFGENGEKDGSYCLYPSGDRYVGWAINWQVSDERTDIITNGTTSKKDIAKDIEEAVKAFKKDKKAKRDNALALAQAAYETCDEANGFVYLKEKKLNPTYDMGVCASFPNGKRFMCGVLLIPIKNVVTGETCNYQVITTEGDKYFTKYLDLPELACFCIGDPHKSNAILYTESVSNAIALNTATGSTVIATMGSGRMPNVVKAVSEALPPHKKLIAADNDFGKDKNAGLIAARKVLELVEDAVIALPPEEDGETKWQWHDHYIRYGASAVAEWFRNLREDLLERRLFDADFVDLSAPTWLVEKMLEVNTLSCLVGPSGVGKSYVAVDLACSIATGKPFLGEMRVVQGLVIYIVGEGFSGVLRRLAGWKMRNDVNSFGGKFHVSKTAFAMLDEAEILALMDNLDACAEKAGEKPVLVIVDTLARNFGDGDENSTKDMSNFIRTVDRCIKDRYNCCTLLVHHTGHDATRERGNSSLRGALDTMFLLNHAEGSKEYSVLRTAKQKDGDEISEIYLTLDRFPLPGLTDNFGNEATTGVVKVVDKAEASGDELLGAAFKVRGNVINFTDILRSIANAGGLVLEDLPGYFGLPKPTQELEISLSKLVGSGYLEMEGSRYKVTSLYSKSMSIIS